jgi:hypothetical protein
MSLHPEVTLRGLNTAMPAAAGEWVQHCLQQAAGIAAVDVGYSNM